MKRFLMVLLLTMTIGCDPNPKPFEKLIKADQTVIKGEVNNWPTDTIYCATLPFHSPYSTVDGFNTISTDRTFEFAFDNVDKPFILLLTAERKFLDHREFLLFEGFTDDYYHGYCKNFFTMPMTTYLIEPGSEIYVQLSKSSRYGETRIRFLNKNPYNSEYFQTTFDIDQRFDEAVTLAESRERAIQNLTSKLNELLSELNGTEKYISPFLYRYVKAVIEFGARKEFLRYLLLDHKEDTSELLENGSLSDWENIDEVIEFDKEKIDHATLITQEYNEFIELYVHYRLSRQKRKLTIWREFDRGKFDLAAEILPKRSRYLYLANNLLYVACNRQTMGLFARLVDEFPDGELNSKLFEKYR